jgi:CheY-like chemotaxis protein
MKRRVLIAEDDPLYIRALEKTLVHHNYDVLSANDGSSVLKILHSNPEIDLIIAKVMLPGLNGFELRKALQSYPGMKDIPIVFVTEHLKLFESARELDPHIVLTKPIQSDDLVKIVVNLLTRL